MLIALDADKKRHQATPDRKGIEYFCPDCEEMVYPKTGPIVIWHFSHYPDSTIPCENRGESILHQECKGYASMLFNGERDDLIEVDFRKEIGRRADVVVEGPPRFVIEIQTSSISKEEILERTRCYNKLGFPVLWLIGKDEPIEKNQLLMNRLEIDLNDILGCTFYISPKYKYKLLQYLCKHSTVPTLELEPEFSTIGQIDILNPTVESYKQCQFISFKNVVEVIQKYRLEDEERIRKMEREYEARKRQGRIEEAHLYEQGGYLDMAIGICRELDIPAEVERLIKLKEELEDRRIKYEEEQKDRRIKEEKIREKYEDQRIKDEKAREEMIQKTGQMGVPVIEINSEFIVGFDKERISQLLNIK